MRLKLYLLTGWIGFLFAFVLSFEASAQTTTVRVMSANLNGNTQSYQPFALRILQGLAPDVVAIQEFNYTSTNGLEVNTPAAFREMIDTCLGTNFVYFRENFTGSGDIPNGIISRYPIVAAGSWADTVQSQPNRGYAWAQIALPGTNTLYVVSVHLLTSSASVRASEATNLKALMQANFPTDALVVLAGDFNTGSRSEAAMVTFDSYLSDNPIPVDDLGNSDTSANRNAPHDYVLPSFSFTNKLTPVLYPGYNYPNGLVFDSRVYSVPALSAFAPVQQPDSGNAQHMAVVKDFMVFGTSTNSTGTAPSITTQPQSQSVAQGGNVSFSVSATGSPSPGYQWLFYGTNINGATSLSYSITNVAFSDAGPYSVLVTNASGSITSGVANLTVTNGAPIITAQPQSQAVTAGQNATFTVGASGSGTLTYQWRFNGTNISTATASSYTRTAVQAIDAGSYSVVVSNSAGTATSADAALTIVTGTSGVIAQWNFNTTNAATVNSPMPSIGSGTITVIGGTAGSWVSGTGSIDGSSPNNAWNTTPYPAATANNKTAGAQFAVSTAGRQNIMVRWDQRESGSGSKYVRLQYTTNGTTYVDYPTAVSVSSTSFEPKTNSLAGLPGVDNNPNFAFRIVAEFQSTATGSGTVGYVGATGTYGTAGTVRFDMMTISGTAIVSNSPPADPAVLSAPIWNTNGQFQFFLTGSSGSNYVVQSSADLSTTNWTSLWTNTAPFTFVDSNSPTLLQKFYRAVTTQ